LLRNLSDQPPDRVRTFLWGIEKLGHIRQVFGQWTVGNEYLRRWLNREWDTLCRVQETPLDESSFEQMLQLGHMQEGQAFQSEVARLESSYAELMDRQHRGSAQASDDFVHDLDRLQRYLTAARRDLHRTQGGDSYRRSSAATNESTPLFRSRLGRDV
jgi:hypothetical protein